MLSKTCSTMLDSTLPQNLNLCGVRIETGTLQRFLHNFEGIEQVEDCHCADKCKYSDRSEWEGGSGNFGDLKNPGLRPRSGRDNRNDYFAKARV